MSRDDIQKLLGGYATGTLTSEEQQALFAAALEDQDLFDALAREQALHDLLRDPAARGQVLAALDEHPEPWWQRATRWMLRPAGIGVAVTCLAAVVGYGIWRSRQPEARLLFSENQPAKIAPLPSIPIPAPEPARDEKARPSGTALRDSVRREARSAPPAAKSLPPPPAGAPVPAGEGTKGTLGEAKKEVTVIAPTVALDAAAAGQSNTNLPATNRSDTNQAATNQAVLNQQAILNQIPTNQSQYQPSQQGGGPARPQALAPMAAPVLAAAPKPDTEKAKAAEKTEPASADALSKLSPRPEIPWTALRRERDGSLVRVDPDQIRAGDAIVLRLTPYANGSLTVLERVPGSSNSRPLVTDAPVERGKTIDTPDVTLDRQGSLDLQVQFTSPGALGGLAGFSSGARAMKNKQGAAAKDSAYGPPPVQTITLHYR